MKRSATELGGVTLRATPRRMLSVSWQRVVRPGLRAIAWLATGLFSAAVHGQPKAPQPVRIGFASPLTGPQAHYGIDNLNGARMAIDALNARRVVIGKNAVRFELLAEDDQADPRTGTIVAQRLVDARVSGMVGHFNSGVTIPASRIYSEAAIPQVSVSTNPKYTRQGYETAFRIMADDDRQGAMLGEYAVRRLGLTDVAVVDDRTAYGQGLADAFAGALKSAGGRVIRREYVSDKDFDFRAVITVLKAASPPAVFFAGYDTQAGPLARQMRELGLQATLLGGETINTAKFLELAGSAAEGHVASTPGAPLAKRPGGAQFAEAYRTRFKQEIGLYAPYFYDGVMLLAHAIEKAGSTEPKRYIGELRRIRYDGVTASIEFDARGDLRNPELSVFRVQNGRWVLQ